MNEATEVVRGEVLTTAQLVAEEALATITEKINRVLDSVEYSQYTVAGLLNEANKHIYDSKYKTLGAYAEDVFGMKKSRASQLKAVGEKFLEKKVADDGTEYFDCILDKDGRNWTVDALYMLHTKTNDVEEAKKLIADGKIKSSMSNKQIEKAFAPQIEKKDEVKEAQAQAQEAQAQAQEAQAQAQEAQEALEAAKDVWNTDLFQINQLANFILEVCQKHASSGVAKQIIKSVEEIERLSHAE